MLPPPQQWALVLKMGAGIKRAPPFGGERLGADIRTSSHVDVMFIQAQKSFLFTHIFVFSLFDMHYFKIIYNNLLNILIILLT